ncbi:hypothetical protein GCM10027290_62040 [Micromonospora sonneratiae]
MPLPGELQTATCRIGPQLRILRVASAPLPANRLSPDQPAASLAAMCAAITLINAVATPAPPGMLAIYRPRVRRSALVGQDALAS